MWIIWTLCAITLLATIFISLRHRSESVIGAWFALALLNPFFTLIKGVTALRLASVAVLAGTALRNRKRPLIIASPFVLMLALALWSAVTAIWSPDPAAALTRALEWVIAAAILGLPWLLTNPVERVTGIAAILAPFTVLAAITTILFRVVPALERAFFESPLSRIMFSTKAVEDILSGRVEANVLLGDGNKAGGILSSNANRTSLILGLAALAYLAIYIYFKHRFALVVSVISIGAVVFTNSKTGIVMLVLAPLLAFILWRATHGWNKRNLGIVASVLVPIGVLGGTGFALFGSKFVDASAATLEPRKAIWATAFELIGHNPIFGSGEGSWDLFWAPVAKSTGFSPAYPPHNFLLRSMIDLGALGTLLIVAVLALLLWTALRQLWKSTSTETAIASALTFAAWVWVIVHGLGDNTEYFGLLNNLPFIALLTMIARAGSSVSPPGQLMLQASPPSARLVRHR